MNGLRIGQVLVDQGVLSIAQVNKVLVAQQRTGRPFGVLCEELLGIDPASIEQAWTVQYARLTRIVDPATEQFDDRALELVTRRQAWQFCVLPIRYDGDELMVATMQHQLLRALRFTCNVLEQPAYLVLVEPEALGRALAQRYPLPGMSAEMFSMSIGLPVVSPLPTS